MVTINPKIETKNLNVWYGDHHVIKDVNLKIFEKIVTAIIGPSGCGKSTFLMTLNRLLDLNSDVHVEGEVLLDGRNIYEPRLDLIEVRRRIGMVFQKPNPLPKSIYENVAYGPRVHGIKDRKVLGGIVETCLQDVVLWDEVYDRLKDSAFELSIGQQQRLCMARALAVKPDVLLMDEPTSSLDPAATAKIERLVRVLGKDYTIIIVTHNMQQAARVSDLTAFLYLGKIIEYGDTRSMFEKPREKLTENYIIGKFG